MAINYLGRLTVKTKHTSDKGWAMKDAILAAVFVLFLSAPMAHANTPECRISADEMRLKGQPRTNYLRRCASEAKTDATIVCDKGARDRRLGGAARNTHVKQCLARAGRGG